MKGSPFETKSVPKAYFSLSLPVVLGMVITIFYNITDTYFIAKTGNTSLVAGISLCAPVFTMLMAFGNIFGQGGSSLISRLLGEKRQDALRRVSSFCFYAGLDSNPEIEDLAGEDGIESGALDFINNLKFYFHLENV